MSPQTNVDPLAQLQDVISPDLPSWWPLSPIYWLLIISCIAFIAVLVYLFKMQHKNKHKQQQAHLQLQQLKQNSANFVLLNQLLKGVALLYFERHQVASLHGEDWFNFIQKHATVPIFGNKQRFIDRLYQVDQQSCTEQDYQQAKTWIKNLPKQIKKQQKEVNGNV